MYEYCKQIDNTASDLVKFREGLNVPFQPLKLEEKVLKFEIVKSKIVYDFDNPIKVINVGSFDPKNAHLVYIGVNYSEAENEKALNTLISKILPNFKGINVDFAYVNLPAKLEFNHIEQEIVYSNPNDETELIQKIKKVYPVDYLVIAVNTNVALGAPENKSAIFSSGRSDSDFIETHEIGHLFGLYDGYETYYKPGTIPNTELFYIDSIPYFVNEELKKLPETPPLYLMGTCLGKPVYTFYDPNNNIMGDYDFDPSDRSWGDTAFTPLQIQIMNDYILSHKN